MLQLQKSWLQEEGSLDHELQFPVEPTPLFTCFIFPVCRVGGNGISCPPRTEQELVQGVRILDAMGCVTRKAHELLRKSRVWVQSPLVWLDCFFLFGAPCAHTLPI